MRNENRTKIKKKMKFKQKYIVNFNYKDNCKDAKLLRHKDSMSVT